MKKVKNVIAILVVAVISITCFFIGGVKGAWHYAMNASGSIDVPMSVEVFPWVGADQLPSDVVGEDHQSLIEKILNGIYVNSDGSVTQIGLNNPNSYINNEIASRADGNFLFRSDVLGSMDFWERNDINKFFDTGTTGLSFVLHFPDGQSDEYYLFTTSIDMGSSDPNVPIGENIYPVYKTVLKKNAEGVWEATETHTGYAQSAYYQNPITGSWLLKYPSFNPDTWVEGDLGSSFDDAVYAFIGQTTTAYNKDATTPKYYVVTSTANQTVKVSSEDSSHVIRVYNSSKSLVNATAGAQGSNSVSFRASRNATYYIEVSGATSITFSIA